MGKRVEVTEEHDVFRRGFISLKEATLRYERFDGQMSEPVTRLYFDRGDSVAALLHDPSADTLTLVEQFRYPAYVTGHGWLLELPAGVVEREHGESEEETMRREIMEETGYEVASLEPITTCYPSPGGSSERIFLYYAQISEAARRGAGGGVDQGGRYSRGHDARRGGAAQTGRWRDRGRQDDHRAAVACASAGWPLGALSARVSRPQWRAESRLRHTRHRARR